jgi:hypothetical protein
LPAVAALPVTFQILRKAWMKKVKEDRKEIL